MLCSHYMEFFVELLYLPLFEMKTLAMFYDGKNTFHNL